jgi:hypothetical protein
VAKRTSHNALYVHQGANASIYPLLSAYNLFGGAVNEAFLRVAPLREVADPSILASPVVGMTTES